MYLNRSKTLYSFLILFFLKEIDATALRDPSPKYDITKIINETVVKLLGTKNSDNLNERILSWMHPEAGKYFRHQISIKNDLKIRPFNEDFFLDGMIFRYTGYPYFSKESKARIRWNTSKAEMSISWNKIRFIIYGKVKDEACSFVWCRHYYEFEVVHVYDNFSITATKLSSNQLDDKKIFIAVSYDRVENEEGIKFSKNYELSYKQILQLKYKIALESTTLISDFFIKSDDFYNFFDSILVTPKERITSIHPDFPDNEHSYYYSIPDIPIVYVNFKNIKIIGLWSFEPCIDNNTISLHTKNVRGNMILDAGFEHFPQFELKFIIDELSMFIDHGIKRIRVMARNYSISELTSKSSSSLSSWLKEFSVPIMDLIESAIETTIMPSMGYLSRSSLSKIQIQEMETSFIQLLKKSADV
ncbi:uncharacterized protein LOC135847542 [Planococcus citri]|uniref:uncharacterized protein LOC135847542 n=1 Tax=Planococcus citri TaxID=170843 RepID=UPI0031F9B887